MRMVPAWLRSQVSYIILNTLSTKPLEREG
jgi:hypothetical protein